MNIISSVFSFSSSRQTESIFQTFVHCIGISTSYFCSFFPGSFLSSIHGSDYGMDNLLLGGGLGEVGEGLAALELGVLDDTCVEDVVLVWLCF